jgi:putative peptidoglycan lipid II flippase
LPSTPAKTTARPLQAAILLSALFFLARVAGLIHVTLVNRFLPTPAAEAFYAAFRLPDVIFFITAGGAMSVTFIPIFTELLQREKEKDAWRFFSTVVTLMGGVLLLLIVLAIAFADPLTRLLNPGFTEAHKAATLDYTVRMTQILVPAQLFFYLGAVLVGVLNAYKRFGATGWNGFVYRALSIVAGYFLFLILGPMGFAWGVLLGAVGGSFLLPLLSSLRGPLAERFQFRPSLDLKQPAVKKFFVNALPIMFGVSLPVFDQVVVGYFASSLDEGAVRNLTTGNRFMLAPLGIVAQAASVAAFPYLAADSASGDWTKFSEFLRSGLRRLLFLTLPLSILLILLAQPLINMLRGGEFGHAAADETAIAFAFYCVGLFAWAGQQLVARGFYALQDTRTPTIIGSVLTIFFFIPLCAWMSRFGVLGLAYATSIGAAAHFVGILIALERRMNQARYNAPLGLKKIMGTLLRTGVACVAMALCGLLVSSLATRVLPDARWADLVRLLVVSIVACAAFGLCAQKFAIPEWFWLRKKFTDQLARRLKRTS